MEKRYSIRGAVAGDLESVFALDQEIATLPHWRMADYLAALPITGQKPNIDGVSRCFFVAQVQSSVVGFAVGRTAGSALAAELESVGVTERMRRSGLGRALCHAVIEWAERMGAADLELEVRSQSAGPIAMYEALGFMRVGRRMQYYREPGDDALIMRLSLETHAAS